MPDIGDRIRELRLRKGFSQHELARRSGVARNTIVRTETGETDPSSTLIVKVAGALGVEPGELFEVPAPLVEEHLLSRLEVQLWLAEEGHKSEGEFLEEVGALESLEDIEDYLREMQHFRELLLAELWNTDVRRRLFPIESGLSDEEKKKALGKRSTLVNRLRWEIRHEFLVRETALSNYSRQLFVENKIDDYLTRVRDPRQHERMLRARQRLLKQSYEDAVV